MYYNNGEIYEGDWKNDIREGKGTYIYKNKEIQYVSKYKEKKIKIKILIH